MLSRNNLLECPIFIFLVRSALLVIAYDSCIRTIDRQSDVIPIALDWWDSSSLSKFQGCFWTMTHVDTSSRFLFTVEKRIHAHTRRKSVARDMIRVEEDILRMEISLIFIVFTIRYVRLSFSSVETIHICRIVNETVIWCYLIQMKKFKKGVIEWSSGFYDSGK